ncbi:unnamed protein product [Brachionus calyciflorus]|uniref:ER membrane protein complex subunit 7 beta-sandwich domain-containing protein n=1 Tax=Brachionus calyciflorus TaxID=104777 RepID=A0A814D2W6_9BILA|nr:unnamed protein product [Brachionus calyciflorus]
MPINSSLGTQQTSQRLLRYSTAISKCSVQSIAYEPVGFESTAVTSQNELFTLRGKVNIRSDELDLENTRILIDDGQYVGFLHSDGTFTIPGLTSGSYVVEISAPRNVYEPVRVDINTKGKIRTRRLNLIQPSDITILRYPLNFESKGYPNYFFKREQFRIMDILLSPMVLMMALPLVIMFVLPKLVSQDPELQRELEQSTNFLPQNQNLPSISEMMYNFVDGGKKKPTANKRQDGQRRK